MEKDPAHRPGSAFDFGNQLRHALAVANASAPPVASIPSSDTLGMDSTIVRSSRSEPLQVDTRSRSGDPVPESRRRLLIPVLVLVIGVITVAVVGILLVGSRSDGGPAAGSTVFSEDFSVASNSNQWGQDFVDGQLRVTTFRPPGISLQPIPTVTRYDVRIEADVINVTAQRGLFGLACLEGADSSMYQGVISRDGSWTIYEVLSGGKQVTLATGGGTSQMAPLNLGGTNHISLECHSPPMSGRGAFVTLAVNGRVLYVVRASDKENLPGTGAGLIVGGDEPNEVWFDNVLVTRLPVD